MFVEDDGQRGSGCLLGIFFVGSICIMMMLIFGI